MSIVALGACCDADRSYDGMGRGSRGDNRVWQDKRPHIAARSVGCFDWVFSPFVHIAIAKRDVYPGELSCTFNGNRTSQRKGR